jgi:uncharacterized phage-like protein YoqJ
MTETLIVPAKKIVSFTGHRPSVLGGFLNPNPIQEKVFSFLRDKLLEIQPEKAITGMALGVDTWAAEVCLELEIPILAAIPFIGQEKIWPKASQEKYRLILERSAEQHVVCEGEYAAWKMQVRNQWMVDHSDIVIAIFTGQAGGTKNCVDYALKKKKEMIVFNPFE